MKNGKPILETERLSLREMTKEDMRALKRILQDPLVMYAYAHAFSDEECEDWLNRQLSRYANDGFGLWAVILKSENVMIGQCGITMQQWGERAVPEVGYLFERAYWHKGFASEAAIACRDYAFTTLGFAFVCSIIRDNNLPSQAVALRSGMAVCDSFVKHYYGMEMPHLVFGVERADHHT